MVRHFRIRTRAVMQRERGYVGLYQHNYQDFQMKRWWGWQTIDTEEVPEYVSCYHSVGGSVWRSKFTCSGSWGRDGLVTLHPSSCLRLV